MAKANRVGKQMGKGQGRQGKQKNGQRPEEEQPHSHVDRMIAHVDVLAQHMSRPAIPLDDVKREMYDIKGNDVLEVRLMVVARFITTGNIRRAYLWIVLSEQWATVSELPSMHDETESTLGTMRFINQHAASRLGNNIFFDLLKMLETDPFLGSDEKLALIDHLIHIAQEEFHLEQLRQMRCEIAAKPRLAAQPKLAAVA